MRCTAALQRTAPSRAAASQRVAVALRRSEWLTSRSDRSVGGRPGAKSAADDGDKPGWNTSTVTDAQAQSKKPGAMRNPAFYIAEPPRPPMRRIVPASAPEGSYLRPTALQNVRVSLTKKQIARLHGSQEGQASSPRFKLG